MTPEYAKIIRALSSCSFLPGSWEKNFVRKMDAKRYDDNACCLSDRQRKTVRDLAQKYRRQLSAEIVALAAALGQSEGKT